jgi:hypothetical protein
MHRQLPNPKDNKLSSIAAEKKSLIMRPKLEFVAEAESALYQKASRRKKNQSRQLESEIQNKKPSVDLEKFVAQKQQLAKFGGKKERRVSAFFFEWT